MKSFINLFKAKLFIVFTGALFLLTACSGMQTAELMPGTNVKNLNQRFADGELASNVDGWVVLLDSSFSMHDPYQGYKKFDIAKTFAERMARTLPDVSSVSGLRTFGHDDGQPIRETKLFYGMSKFNQNQFMQSLNQVKRPSGMTPMVAAIENAGADLSQVTGKKAIILISDGLATDYNVLSSVKNLKNEMGSDICVYTVLVGDDPEGRQNMSQIARSSNCGMMVSAMETLPGSPMADYVTDVFFTENQMQQTAQTEPEPEEPAGLGYSKAPEMMRPLEGIHFHFDESRLTRDGKSILDENIQALKENPEVEIVVEGHASAKGPDAYNMQLSEKRARSVKNYLVNQGGIASDRISTVGYGETQPKVEEPEPQKARSPEALANMRVELKTTKDNTMDQ